MSTKEPSGWVIGFTAFASIMMIMQGAMWIISGLIGVFNNEFFVVSNRWIFQFDISTWSWIHMILGIVILLSGFFVFTGAIWARTVGVIIAVIAALLSFSWLPYYPIWAIIFIVISVAVIWALTVHGRDIPKIT